MRELRQRLHRQRQIDLMLAAGQVDRRDLAGEAGAAVGRHIGDHRRVAQVADRLQSQQLRVPGPDADPEEPAGNHGLCTASWVTGIAGRQPW